MSKTLKWLGSIFILGILCYVFFLFGSSHAQQSQKIDKKASSKSSKVSSTAHRASSSQESDSASSVATSSSVSVKKLSTDEMEQIALDFVKSHSTSPATVHVAKARSSPRSEWKDETTYDVVVFDTPQHFMEVEVNAYTGKPYNYALSEAAAAVTDDQFLSRETDILSQLNAATDDAYRRGGQAANSMEQTDDTDYYPMYFTRKGANTGASGPGAKVPESRPDDQICFQLDKKTLKILNQSELPSFTQNIE